MKPFTLHYSYAGKQQNRVPMEHLHQFVCIQQIFHQNYILVIGKGVHGLDGLFSLVGKGVCGSDGLLKMCLM